MNRLDLGIAGAFQPAKLTTARSLRGHTKSALADLTGVTHAAISQFESGKHAPSPQRLQELAFALAFPVAFFRDEPPVAIESGAFFRKRSRTPARDRACALAHTDLAVTLTSALSRYVELPRLNVLRSPVSGDVSLAEIERIAAVTRVSLGLGRGSAPPLARTLEANGVLVLKNSEIGPDVDAFSRRFELAPVMILNGRKADTERTRFDIAHELGHIVMHTQVGQGTKLAEIQADAFAAAFLMPRADIVELLPTRLDDWARFNHLKREWGVSIAALLRRCRDLGRLTEQEYRSGQVRLGRLGHRRGEPNVSDGTETPTLWRRALDVLAGDVTLEQIVADANVPLDVAVAVLGMPDGSVRKRITWHDPAPVIRGAFG